jgi:flagellar basal-body rod modification protein FlgD
MSTVNNNTYASGAGTSRTSTASLSSASAAEQQDRFMKLLVAQMKNQDPLNPMDNAQMTSQIAQINTVGGLEKLNRTVEGLLSAFGGLQLQSAAQLPGRNVLVEGGAITLSGGAAAGGVELGTHADAVTVEILGADGQPVHTLELGPRDAGVHGFRWDGLMANGEAAAEGSYRLRITASAQGQPVPTASLVAARVNAVSPGDAGVMLDLGSAGVRAWAEVKSFL